MARAGGMTKAACGETKSLSYLIPISTKARTKSSFVTSIILYRLATSPAGSLYFANPSFALFPIVASYLIGDNFGEIRQYQSSQSGHILCSKDNVRISCFFRKNFSGGQTKGSLEPEGYEAVFIFAEGVSCYLYTTNSPLRKVVTTSIVADEYCQSNRMANVVEPLSSNSFLFTIIGKLTQCREIVMTDGLKAITFFDPSRLLVYLLRKSNRPAERQEQFVFPFQIVLLFRRMGYRKTAIVSCCSSGCYRTIAKQTTQKRLLLNKSRGFIFPNSAHHSIIAYLSISNQANLLSGQIGRLKDRP